MSTTPLLLDDDGSRLSSFKCGTQSDHREVSGGCGGEEGSGGCGREGRVKVVRGGDMS